MRKEKRRLERVKLVQNITLFVLLIFLVYFIINTFIFTVIRVDGHSMEPTFTDGQKLVFSKLNISNKSLKRGEIIVFEDREDHKYVKRVIGLPGELVELKDGQIYINGSLLDDELNLGYTYRYNVDSWYLKLDQIFVLGDNRSQNDSKDSRIFGPIEIKDVDGKFMFKL